MKINKQQLFTMASVAITMIGMFVSNKAQEEELREMKEQIKLELREEKENQNG